jgi:squalene-hopene/tetraprenyl-beta-curcumene cyclase
MRRFALHRSLFLGLLLLIATGSTPGLRKTWAQETAAEISPPALLATLVQRGTDYLATQQSPDGSFSSHTGTGVTALVTTALLRHGHAPDHPVVARALEYLLTQVQADGGIYQPGSLYRNYETCLAVLCFSEANHDGQYEPLLKKAEAFLKDLQWDDGEGHDPSSTSYGGAGYGKHNRPDLSNTNFLVDALLAVGNGPDDPAIQRALVFVSRCQNLQTKDNQTPFADKNPDGGFYYTAAAGGSSQAGETASGGLRSYGSMTYAGLKSMLYAGVGPQDPRVQAALDWIQKNYSIQTNPGMGDSGLFYYYHTFAKALQAVGKNQIADPEGRQHDWRQELIAELARRQQPDGSWQNQNERWLEGDPNLVTGYVLLTLSYCQDDQQSQD